MIQTTNGQKQENVQANEDKKQDEVKKFLDKKVLIEKICPWVALFLVLAGAGFYYFYNQKPVLSLEQAKVKAEEFINKNLLQGRATASVGQIVKESGLYKISLNVNGQNFTSFMTQDGKKFFIDAIDMDEVEKQQDSGQPEVSEAPQSEKPKVELFVMSYCPYGLQMEKAILPVLALLKEKIDFQLKFVDYLMHGKQELDENLRQYCIGQQGIQKLEDYLACFVKEGKYQNCLSSAKINAAELSACEKITDKDFSLSEKFQEGGSNYPPFDIFSADNQKYGVSGSPTLVINETKVAAARNPEALKQLICKSFLQPPAECSTSLSTETPSAGFGEGNSTSSGGNCGG